jgi:hypothetical protein
VLAIRLKPLQFSVHPGLSILKPLCNHYHLSIYTSLHGIRDLCSHLPAHPTSLPIVDWARPPLLAQTTGSDRAMRRRICSALPRTYFLVPLLVSSRAPSASLTARSLSIDVRAHALTCPCIVPALVWHAPLHSAGQPFMTASSCLCAAPCAGSPSLGSRLPVSRQSPSHMAHDCPLP